MDEAAVLTALGPHPSDRALSMLASGARAIDCPQLGSGRLVLPRYSEVRQLLRDPRFLCAPTARGMLAEMPGELSGLVEPVALWVLYTDPPLHARLRGVMAKAFTARHIAALRESIVSRAGRLVDSFCRMGEDDAVTALAEPLPVHTISMLMGIDAPPACLKTWSDDVVLLTEPELTEEEQARLAAAWRGLSSFFTEVIECRRRSPASDVISALVQAEVDGERLSQPELVANCIALLVGGHETTSSLLSSLVLAALDHRALRDLVLADSQYAAGFVEEVLRLHGPSKMTARTAACDVEVGDVRIEEGRRLILLQSTANRDPEAFVEPNAFRPERHPNPHVGFGFGPHACFGAALARLQAGALLHAFMRQVDRFEVDAARVTWKPSQVLRTPSAIPVRRLANGRDRLNP